MKIGPKTYRLVRQIHLYSTLVTTAFLLMYIVSSIMFMNHDLFHVDVAEESESNLKVAPEEINEENWPGFLKNNGIRGKLWRERVNKEGDHIREYESAGADTRITIFRDKSEVKIVHSKLNLSGQITGVHRMRGYGGSFLYNAYAFILDIVGICLILFTVTGVILWLKLLQFNKVAWAILISGFIYVSAVIAYLMSA